MCQSLNNGGCWTNVAEMTQYSHPLQEVVSACWECLTCCHVDQDTLAGPQIGHVEQHDVGGQVVYRHSSTFLEAHLVRHGEGIIRGHNNHFLPHATAAHHDDTIPHLREDGRGGSRGQGHS